MRRHPSASILENATRELPQVILTTAVVPAGKTQTQSDLHQDCDCDCACMVRDQRDAPLLSSPLVVYLELTPFCPNRCPGCGNVFVDRRQRNRLPPPLAAAAWAELLPQFLPGLNLVRLTGGEPTMHPEFFEIIELLRESNVDFALLTSGRWAQPKRLLDKLSECDRFRGFLISLHGPDAAVHESFTATPGSFQDATEAIRMASRVGFNVAASTVLVAPNSHLVRETTSYALSLGAGYAVFNRFVGQPPPSLALAPDALFAALAEILMLRDEWPIKLGNCVPLCFAPGFAHGCSAGSTFCTVDPWGQLRPCNHSTQIVGDLTRQSLGDIWQSGPMVAWRSQLSALCRQCPDLAACQGGCRALVEQYGRDPLCTGLNPVTSRPAPVPSLTLHAHAVPSAAYTLHYEAEQPILIRGSRAIPVTKEEAMWLSTAMGNKSLEKIQAEDGERCLAFVGLLYREQFVHLPQR